MSKIRLVKVTGNPLSYRLKVRKAKCLCVKPTKRYRLTPVEILCKKSSRVHKEVDININLLVW